MPQTTEQRVFGKALPELVGEGVERRPWFTKLGEGITDEKVQALINAGYGYNILGGTTTTPITGNGAYISTTPDMDILVPMEKAFIPLSISVGYEIIGTSLLLEVIALAGLGGAQGAATAVTPVNLDSGRPDESGLICRSPSTGATLMTQRVQDIFHEQETLAITKTAGSATASAFDRNKYVYRAKDEGFYHILRGANNLQARLNVWGAAQGPTLFIIVKGLCVPVGFISPA